MKFASRFTAPLCIAVTALCFSPLPARAEDEGRKLNFDEDKAYEHVIAPILATRCIGCHGAEKQKGKFALHTPEAIGSSETIVAGKPDESAVIERIMLPDDDEDVMPPEDKPRLSDEQKKLIAWWIATGADYEKKIGELQIPDAIQPILTELVYVKPRIVEITRAFNLPEPAGAADAGAVQAVEKAGVLIMPLAQDTKYLTANALNVAKSFNDEQLKLLVPVKDHLTWLDVSRTGITDAAAADLGQLGMLTKLHLENTAVSDAVLAELGKLDKLEYLNLYGTKVTDAGLEHLKGLKSLKRLYVWQTGVTEAGAKMLQEAIPGLEINMGWKAPAENKPPEGEGG